jgi:signal transduction histidine kinase
MDTRRPATGEPDESALRRELDDARRHVAELTEELEATNRGIIALHSELDRAREAEARVRAEHEVLADRERIADQLHDQVIRRLLGAALDLTGTLHMINRPATVDRVQRVIDDIDGAVRQLRGTIFDLHTPERTTGLQVRLVELVSQAHTALGFVPDVNVTGGSLVETVPADTAAHVLAATEDMVTFIAGHGATRAEFTLHVADDVILCVTADSTAAPDHAPAGTTATVELERRAATLGGTCTVTHAPAGGGGVEWRVPLGPPTVPSPPRPAD